MDPSLLAYLGALVATIIAVLGSVFAYVYHSRNALELDEQRAEYELLAARLPDACRLQDLEARVAERMDEYDQLSHDLAIAQAAIEEKTKAEEWLRTNQAELLTLESERQQQERLRGQLQSAEKEWSQLREQIREDQKQADEAAIRKARIQGEEAELRQWIERTRAQMGSMEERLAGLREELVSADAERQQQERVRAELEACQAELGSVVEDLRTAVQEATAAQVRRDQLRAELHELRSASESHQQRVHELEKHLDALKTEDAALSAKIARWREASSQAEEDCEHARKELVGAEESVARNFLRVQELTIQQTELKTEVEGFRAERKGLEDSIATLRATHEQTLEQLRQTGQLGEDADKELWVPVLLRRETEYYSQEELPALDDVSAYMEGRGLAFSERTLRAFHTSLKIADISPLVVLAGISGTGKSELPRRYAEAMGMEFLLMPVQPRWDSPQDLFGFYNYLEGRFRPTELTRALVQMDRYSRVGGRGWNLPKSWKGSRSDAMLLVLLDEMNLARVEYYFSEFLSKLETRRGVDPDSNADRSKAEIALEIGRRKNEAAIMRLFVDTNVLFVGTMNEDESTQTLSDKVVDRANVLRFGKPNRLRARTLEDRTPEPMALSHETWQSWFRPDEDLAVRGVSDQVDRWIAHLNSAMDKIGRPFAHRANQAMRLYVANYPEQTDDGVRFAMSDQIEQRILPKFRGLDPSEPAVSHGLDLVRKLVSELGDQPLLASVDSARNDQHQPQFTWQGVDRFVVALDAV